MNKRGLELAINTIVIFILAIVLLVLMVYLLTDSSSKFEDKIQGFAGYSNVDEINDGCRLLVNIEHSYEFCCEKRVVKYFEDGNKVEGEFSCSDMADKEEFDVVKRWDCSNLKC